MRRFSALVLALATGVALSACGTEEPAEVKERASESQGDIVTEGSAEPSEGEESTPATAQLGDVVTVGTWDVKVTEVVLNADQVIRKANQFNDQAKGQFVLVTYEATYTGSERTADAWGDLSWSFTTTDSQVHDPSAQVTPADDEEWPTEARQGGTVKGQEVFDLDPALVKGGILTVEGYDEDYDTVYADFIV